MPPEFEVWKRVAGVQARMTRFYVKSEDPSIVWCVMPRSPMLIRSVGEMKQAKQAAADRRTWNEQARRLASQVKQKQTPFCGT